MIRKRTCLVPFLKVLIIVSLFSGCTTPAATPPFSQAEPLSVRIIAGSGEAYKYQDGDWVRFPAYDYEFTVVQKTYPEGWESIKQMHRGHPEYDIRGGPRDETLYFSVAYAAPVGETVPLTVEGTLGKGAGHADRQFREMVIEFKPDISRFAPFNTYRIRQKIEGQKLSETVELFKKKDGKEVPFMKMVEVGAIYDPSATDSK